MMWIIIMKVVKCLVILRLIMGGDDVRRRSLIVRDFLWILGTVGARP